LKEELSNEKFLHLKTKNGCEKLENEFILVMKKKEELRIKCEELVKGKKREKEKKCGKHELILSKLQEELLDKARILREVNESNHKRMNQIMALTKQNNANQEVIGELKTIFTETIESKNAEVSKLSILSDNLRRQILDAEIEHSEEISTLKQNILLAEEQTKRIEDALSSVLLRNGEIYSDYKIKIDDEKEMNKKIKNSET